MNLRITKDNKAAWKGTTLQCATGQKGFTNKPAEGDMKTPIGTFPLRRIFYRADRVNLPAVHLPNHVIQGSDGWCDDPDSAEYNTWITKPFAMRHEDLWRADNIYDIIVVLGFNDAPIEKDKGSAIFLHVARPGFVATAGCVALEKDALLALLPEFDKRTCIEIG